MPKRAETTDAVAWARAARPNPSRVCETCRWLRRTPSAARWLALVLGEVKAGRSAAPMEAIRRAIVERFDYPLRDGAFANHVKHGERA